MGHSAEMGGCAKLIKYFMFLSNFIIFAGGIVVLALGIWTIVDKAFVEELLGTNLYMSAAYIFIGTGCVIIIISFLGCYGAIKEIKCMLLTYTIIVSMIFVTLLIGGILGYVFRERVRDTMENEMRASLKKYEHNKVVKAAWDNTQTAYQCCGVDSYTNWVEQLRGHVPASCCRPGQGREDHCVNNPSDANTYKYGCLSKVLNDVKEHAQIIGASGIVVACLMVLGIIFAIAMFLMIK